MKTISTVMAMVLVGFGCYASDTASNRLARCTNEVVQIKGKLHRALVKKDDSHASTLVMQTQDISQDPVKSPPRTVLQLKASYLVEDGWELAVNKTGSRACVLVNQKGPGTVESDLYCYDLDPKSEGEPQYVPHVTVTMPGQTKPSQVSVPISSKLTMNFQQWEEQNARKIGNYKVSEHQLRFTSDTVVTLTGVVGKRYRFSLSIDLTTPGSFRSEPLEMTAIEPPVPRAEAK